MLRRLFWLNLALFLALTFDISHGDVDDYHDSALEVKDDYANKKCSDFENDGFRCAPFYGCLSGEIITNGATLINIRWVSILISIGLKDVFLKDQQSIKFKFIAVKSTIFNRKKTFSKYIHKFYRANYKVFRHLKCAICG